MCYHKETVSIEWTWNSGQCKNILLSSPKLYDTFVILKEMSAVETCFTLTLIIWNLQYFRSDGSG